MPKIRIGSSPVFECTKSARNMHRREEHIYDCTEELLIFLKVEVKGPKSTKFDPTYHLTARYLDPIPRIWSKFDMDLL